MVSLILLSITRQVSVFTLSVIPSTSPLFIDFIINTANVVPTSAQSAMDQITAFAGVLRRHPGENLVISGNIGFPAVQPAGQNQGPVAQLPQATINLSIQRANFVGGILITNFGINPNRITVQAGTWYNSPFGFSIATRVQ